MNLERELSNLCPEIVIHFTHYIDVACFNHRVSKFGPSRDWLFDFVLIEKKTYTIFGG